MDLPPGIGHLIPKWFKTPARKEGDLCVNCWGRYHGVTKCDATPEEKEKGRTEAQAFQAREAEQRQLAADRMEFEGVPSQEDAVGAGGEGNDSEHSMGRD
jgi:hypothetical protein